MVTVQVEELSRDRIPDETKPPFPSEGREAVRRTLRMLRSEVVGRVRSLRASTRAEPEVVKDRADKGAEEAARELEDALVEEALDTLRQIDEARTRLDEGMYGACRRCGATIAEERLRALPFAVLCRPCQQREEARPTLAAFPTLGLFCFHAARAGARGESGAALAENLRAVLRSVARANPAPGSSLDAIPSGSRAGHGEKPRRKARPA